MKGKRDRRTQGLAEARFDEDGAGVCRGLLGGRGLQGRMLGSPVADQEPVYEGCMESGL